MSEATLRREISRRTAAPAIAGEYAEHPAGQPPHAADSPYFLAIVTGATAINSDPTTLWKYKAKRVVKAASGYGTAKWTTLGDEIDCYNGCENPNDQDGLQGNGVSLADLAAVAGGDYAIQRVQDGVIALLTWVPVASPDGGEPSTEAWIVAVPNGVTGECQP